MAHFRGIVQGTRGTASRLGTRNSGLETVAASWQGAVRVYLYEHNGADFARVELVKHCGQGTYRTLYDGRVDGAEGVVGMVQEVA